jgi:hypothetical protein
MMLLIMCNNDIALPNRYLYFVKWSLNTPNSIHRGHPNVTNRFRLPHVYHYHLQEG